jgi:hypothetical protein
MAHVVTHPFVSPVPDDLDPDDVGPDEWNAAHQVIIDESLIDHGGLSGLGDDDHPQYFLNSNAAALTRVNDTNVTLTLGGTPATALLQAVSLTLGWTGQLSIARGGTGSATPFLPPSNAIGLTVNNGVLNSFMRSDATPALDQGIAPTWTSLHTFSAGLTSTVVNATTGFRISGGATLNKVLKGDGTNFVEGNVAASEITGGAALTKTDDTNVTLTLGGTPASALLKATSLTLGWTGTLAAARLNANVVQAITNDTNVTGSIATQTLTLSWTGTLAVSRGGIGVGTLASNGVLYGNGTGAVQALAVNSTATNKFLTQSSSAAPAWATIVAGDLPGSFSGFANPTASLGLAAVNGSATTAMRSDAAPALSQSISPSWTGTHTHTLANGNPVILRSGASGSYVFLSLGRTATEASIAMAASAGQFLASAAAGDLVIRNDSSSAFVHLGAGSNTSSLVVSNADVRAPLAMTVGKNAAPDSGALLHVSSGTTAASDQGIAIGPGIDQGTANGLNLFYGGGSLAVGTSIINAHAATASLAKLLIATQGNQLASFSNADGGFRVSFYVSTMSSSLAAPTNVTAGDASFKRILAGTDAAISNVWGGSTVININAAAGINTINGLLLSTPTAATNGVQANSPAVVWQGNGWKTNATASSQPVKFAAYAVPTQAATGDGYLAIASETFSTGVFPFVHTKIWHGGVVDTATGFRISGAAADGYILLGNGTNFVASSTVTANLAYSSGDYTADVGTWTVDSGDILIIDYQIFGKLMNINFFLQTTTTASNPNYLYIKVPAGKTIANYAYNAVRAWDSAGGTQYNAIAFASASATSFGIARSIAGLFGSETWPNLTNSLYITGQITIPIL